MMSNVLLVAATDDELCGHEGLVCGIGPVEAAITTARELSQRSPRAVLNIGIAGSRGVTPGGLVIGSEAVYCDISAEISVIERVEPDSGLLTSLREAIPEALVLPIGTSATVGGSMASSHRNMRVEGMEGFAVLCACSRASVPAIEVRAISNEISEGDRSRWRIGRALEAMSDALPRLIAAAE
jgi:predicted 5'-methylthioadenosine/S-adenosylhomocysteine nucleosidase